MSMSKHTPGPWAVQDDHGKRWIETGGNDDTIAEIHRRRDKGSVYSCPEAAANARLIAAAPDLLEELEETHSALCFTADYIGTLRYERNKAAIAKARGHQP